MFQDGRGFNDRSWSLMFSQHDTCVRWVLTVNEAKHKNMTSPRKCSKRAQFGHAKSEAHCLTHNAVLTAQHACRQCSQKTSHQSNSLCPLKSHALLASLSKVLFTIPSWYLFTISPSIALHWVTRTTRFTPHSKEVQLNQSTPFTNPNRPHVGL